MSTNYMFGWELLFKSIEKDVKSESDIIIALVHWYLTCKSGMMCLGIGDNKTLSPDEETTELLPAGWNEIESSYSLRYKFNEELFILTGNISDESLIINLLSSKSLQLSNLNLNPKINVKQLNGPINKMLPELQTVLHRIKTELVEAVFNTKTINNECQTDKQDPEQFRSPPPPQTSDQPRRIIDPRDDYMFRSRSDPLRNIGRGDLDPLGRGGDHGMLFNPPGMAFPNAPGGPRFDPYMPPIPDRQSNIIRRPNPDSPDYDDMFY